MKMRRNSRPHKLLEYLALGSGVLIISVVAPQSGAKLVQAAISGYLVKQKMKKEHFLRDLKSLQSRKLINYQDLGNGTVKIEITKAGKQKILLYNLEKIKLKKPVAWDRKWRLVIFDIPHSLKKARDALRGKLLILGFYPIQKSVFITPYPCEDEIDFIASIFDIRRHILVLYVSHFEGEEKLKYHFRM